MRLILTLLIVLSTSVPACDEQQSPDVPTAYRTYEEGTMWGPCPSGECKDGFCFVDADGSICAPACAPVCPPQPVNMCGDDIGVAACDPTGACRVGCNSDADCGAGTVCGPGFCVWP